MKSDSKDVAHGRAWCRIIDYLDAEHPNVASVVTSCCANYSLGAAKGKAGVTFIMPNDALLKKLNTLVMSSSPADLDKANDIVNAHVFRFALKTAADWMANKDNLPNALSISQHVELESADNSGIKFKNGAKAVLDTDFIDGSRKRNLAVYKLVSGEISVTTDKNAKPNAGQLDASKKGSGDNTVSRSQRCSAVAAIGAIYKAEAVRKHAGINAITRAIYSLVSVMMNSDKDWFRDSVMPLVSKNHFTLFALVEPFRQDGHLVPDHLIAEWLTHGRNGDFTCSRSHIASVDASMLALAQTGNAAIYTNNAGVIAEINKIRGEVFSKRGKPKSIITEIEKHYDILERTNTIGSISNVYPSAFAAWLQSNIGLKISYDELAFCTYMSFDQIESRGDARSYNSDIMRVGSCLVAADSNARAKARLLLRKTLATAVSVDEATIERVLTFVCSTCFLGVPVRAAVSKNSVTVYPPPSAIGVIFDIEAACEARCKCQCSATVGPSVGQLIAGLDLSALTAEDKERLIASIRSV